MRRIGFNVQWFFSAHHPHAPDERDLAFMAVIGCDLVRIPLDYRYWTAGTDYLRPDQKRLEVVDRYVRTVQDHGLHVSLNLHRAPGYCINDNHLETHNLWTDEVAQDGFVGMWEAFARRYAHIPSSLLSFDLLNEPPSEGQYGMTRDGHAALMRRTVAAIRAIDPDRDIVLNGIGGGHEAIPELAGLAVSHSGRGYLPIPVSHHGAEWMTGFEQLPAPAYPGLVWAGVTWDKQALRESYRPWREVQATGTDVLVGEFGCYNKTANDVAVRWLDDLTSLYDEYGWGYAFWEFRGSFGIVDHGRPGARLGRVHGVTVDLDLLSFLERSIASRA